MSEIKCYAVSISTDEFYDLVVRHDKKLDKLMEVLKTSLSFVGVWQEPHGLFQAFLFRSSNARNRALEKILEMGFETAAAMIEPAYVDTSLLGAKQ